MHVPCQRNSRAITNRLARAITELPTALLHRRSTLGADESTARRLGRHARHDVRRGSSRHPRGHRDGARTDRAERAAGASDRGATADAAGRTESPPERARADHRREHAEPGRGGERRHPDAVRAARLRRGDRDRRAGGADPAAGADPRADVSAVGPDRDAAPTGAGRRAAGESDRGRAGADARAGAIPAGEAGLEPDRQLMKVLPAADGLPARVRAEPNTRSPILLRVPLGATVEVIGQASGDELQPGNARWLRIRWKEQTGWVYSSLLGE